MLDFGHRKPRNYLKTGLLSDMCDLPEMDRRLREQGDAPQAGPSTLISGPGNGALTCKDK